MESLVGQRLGNYQIIAPLGEGGMATVYRAQQINIKREVAVKVIRPQLARASDFIRRFEREAETIAVLDHPHIIKLFDYGHQGDMVYLVTPLLRGGSLANLLGKGLLPVSKVSKILDQISSALEYAHSRGVIHRDLKPQNVLLDEQGNAFLTDFGIARLVAQKTALTASGVAIGTPAYMPPEQWQGGVYDSRADIYALGIVLFEMLTGQLPFDAKTPASLMYSHLQQPAPRVISLRPDLPPGIDAVITRVLAKNPDDRYQSADELAQAFKAATLGQIPSYVPPQISTNSRAGTSPDVVPTQPGSRFGRSTLLGVGVVALALILIGGSILFVLAGNTSVTPTPAPTNAAIILPTVPTRTVEAAGLATSTSAPQPTETASAMPTMTVTVVTATLVDTPNQGQTISAIVNSTLTAAAIQAAVSSPSATQLPVSTATPMITLTITSALSTQTLSPVPCMVSTDVDNKVEIRVGPGDNRGLRDYMPAGQVFLVVGQAQASDGSPWWKLKTDDNSEAWVAQADVSASGDCAQLSVAPTPPIQTAKPTATKTPTPRPTKTPTPKPKATRTPIKVVTPPQFTPIFQP